MVRRGALLVAMTIVALSAHSAPVAASPWQAQVVSRKITPSGPIWLAGYANRAAPSSGVESDIYAKALALNDGQGGRAVIVTLDLIRVPRALREVVEHECERRFGLQPSELLLNASHTHSGPEVEPDRMVLEAVFSRMAKPEDVAVVVAYQDFLRQSVVELIEESLQGASPARLEFSQARAGFAMNRRRPEAGGAISNNPNPAGPVDHDVPVLKVIGADNRVRALLFGYACHNTTLSGSRISGDYAGHAQRYLETSYPGAKALFLMGCGGDQNPYPRGTMVPGQTAEDLAQQHGRALANAVHTAIGTRSRAVLGPLRTAYGQADLEYELMPKAELAQFAGAAHTPQVIERARRLSGLAERRERAPPLPCPVQVLQFGRDLTLVAIAGEVVVDYSLRIKREFKGPAEIWVAGYSNDVFGYLGSRRVIAEGGYEGGGANTRILNHPGRFTTGAEEAIMTALHGLHRQVAPASP